MLRRADSLFATNDEFPMPDGMESQCAESSDKTDVAVCAESSGTSTTSGHCQKQYRMKREQEAAAFAAAKSQIYYKRQLLGLSLDGRRLDLLTITDWSNHGNAEDEQGMPPGLFPAASQGPSKAFKGKKVSRGLRNWCGPPRWREESALDIDKDLWEGRQPSEPHPGSCSCRWR